MGGELDSESPRESSRKRNTLLTRSPTQSALKSGKNCCDVAQVILTSRPVSLLLADAWEMGDGSCRFGLACRVD